MDKATPFRAWLQNKWIEYKNELFEMDGIVVQDRPAEYFQRYKWWLKGQYKMEKQK